MTPRQRGVGRVTERERETHTERDRDRDRDRQTQTQRHIHRDTDTETQTQRHRQTESTQVQFSRADHSDTKRQEGRCAGSCCPGRIQRLAEETRLLPL